MAACLVLFLAGCGMYTSTPTITLPVRGSATNFIFASNTQTTGSDETIQGPSEELPEALGMYLVTKQGLRKWEEMPLLHKKKSKLLGGEEISPALNTWTSPPVEDVKSENFQTIIAYYAFGAKDPEDFKLYRLIPKKDFKPHIKAANKINLSIVPITGVPGILGNMVRLTPETVLSKGNYLLTEGHIETANRCWGFTINGGEQMWQEITVAQVGCGCLLAGVGIVVVWKIIDWLAEQIAEEAVEPLYGEGGLLD